jgi:hypothetical protein
VIAEDNVRGRPRTSTASLTVGRNARTAMTPSEPQNRQAVDQTSRDPHAAVGGLSVSSLSEPTSVMVIVASQLSRWLDFAPRGSRLLSAMAPTPPVARRPRRSNHAPRRRCHAPAYPAQPMVSNARVDEQCAKRRTARMCSLAETQSRSVCSRLLDKHRASIAHNAYWTELPPMT